MASVNFCNYLWGNWVLSHPYSDCNNTYSECTSLSPYRSLTLPLYTSLQSSIAFYSPLNPVTITLLLLHSYYNHLSLLQSVIPVCSRFTITRTFTVSYTVPCNSLVTATNLLSQSCYSHSFISFTIPYTLTLLLQPVISCYNPHLLFLGFDRPIIQQIHSMTQNNLPALAACENILCVGCFFNTALIVLSILINESCFVCVKGLAFSWRTGYWMTDGFIGKAIKRMAQSENLNSMLQNGCKAEHHCRGPQWTAKQALTCVMHCSHFCISFPHLGKVLEMDGLSGQLNLRWSDLQTQGTKLERSPGSTPLHCGECYGATGGYKFHPKFHDVSGFCYMLCSFHFINKLTPS